MEVMDREELEWITTFKTHGLRGFENTVSDYYDKQKRVDSNLTNKIDVRILKTRPTYCNPNELIQFQIKSYYVITHYLRITMEWILSIWW